MNKVILIGRLTRDPELRYTQSNKAVAQFTIATDRPSYNGEKETDFHNIVAWDKMAENVGKYMSKGRLIAVEGRIQYRNYENNEGKKVYITEIIASNVQFLESKNSSANNQQVTTQNTTQTDYDPYKDFGEQLTIDDSELPF